jgi:pimeloyl-ACP methyl ester carboxylesterase
MRQRLFVSHLLWIVLLVIASSNTLVSHAQDTGSSSTSSPEVIFPELTGPYKVGRTSFEWVDESREETFASIPGLKRDLMVYIWFPATLVKRTKIAPYMDGGLLWDIWSIKPGLEGMVHTHAYQTTFVDKNKPNYPVLIFLPGAGGISLNYASIIEEIASHGYIVIGTSHPYSTAAISYPDGRILVSKGGNATQPSIWIKDVQFVLAQAEKLNTTDKYFAGHLDLSRVGVFGHSFGGRIAGDLMAIDLRIKAGAALDAGSFAKIGSKPFLAVGSPSSVQNHTPDDYWLTIEGTRHLNYGDFPLLLPILPDTPFIGDIDPEHGIKIINSYLLAFFDHYLNGAELRWPAYDEEKLITLK